MPLMRNTGRPLPRPPRALPVAGSIAAMISAIELPPNAAISSLSYSATGGWSTISCPRMRAPVTTIVPGADSTSSLTSGAGSAAWPVSWAWTAEAQPSARSEVATNDRDFKRRAFRLKLSNRPRVAAYCDDECRQASGVSVSVCR